MSAEGLSSHFGSFAAFRNALKNHGIEDRYMNPAIEKIASQNNLSVDELKEIDGSEKIDIAGSIFQTYATAPVQAAQNDNDKDVLKSFFEVNDDNVKAPEVFNMDEYEVADYDDYYNFGAANQQTQQQSEQKQESPLSEDTKIDFETFKNDYSQGLVPNGASDDKKEDILKGAFAKFDTNSDSFLDKSELDAARMMTSPFGQEKELGKTNTVPQEGEDLLGANMMQMNMSGESFNPQ